jgi:MoaA/NifB/PqqE/SkfB family radical SAM enzyme
LALKVTVDINSACNHDCTFCYAAYYRGQLSLTDFTRQLGRYERIDEVQIGGGEPLLHPELPAMVRYALGRGSRVHIATNGTLTPPGLLALAPPEKDATGIQVSLHASTPGLHARITGRDSFHRILGNLGIFRQHFPTTLSCAVYQDNLADVPGIIRLAREHGIPLRVNPVLAAGNGRDVARLDARQLGELADLLLVEYLRGGIESPLIHPSNCIALERDYGIPKTLACPTETGMKAYIRPDGSIHGCEWLAPPASGEPAPRYEVA